VNTDVNAQAPESSDMVTNPALLIALAQLSRLPPVLGSGVPSLRWLCHKCESLLAVHDQAVQS
jgi:hypothetical protein